MTNESVLVDTGPLIALYSSDDSYHESCKQQLGMLPLGKLFTCWPVVVETVYMLRRSPEQRDDFLNALINGDFNLLPLWPKDLEAVTDIFTKYHDHTIDLADACLLHLADRDEINTVLTIDHRHFSMFRKLNGDALRLLPILE